MRYLLSILLLTSAVSLGDTVWEYPFAELGAVWNFGSAWSDSSTGVSYEGSIWGDGTDAVLSSGLMTIPAGYTEITVEMDSYWHHTGGTMDGGVSMTVQAVTSNGSSTVNIFNDSDSHSSWNWSSFDESSTDEVSGTSSADFLELEFEATQSGYGYIYESNLTWTLSNMTITGHGTGLSRHTWGGIKGSYL